MKKHKRMVLLLGFLLILMTGCSPVGQLLTPLVTPTQTAFTPSPSPILTPSAVADAQTWLSDYLGVSVDQIGLQSIEHKDWRDGCLELGQPNEGCLDVITPGWQIIFLVNGQPYEVHTNDDLSMIRVAENLDVTPGPSVQVENTQWTLTSFGLPGDESLETPVLTGTTLTLEFQPEGQAVGSGGCNSFGASYKVTDNQISFSKLVSTKIACTDEGVMEQEQKYFDALKNAGTLERADNTLKIWYGDQQGTLNFTLGISQAAQNMQTDTPQQTGARVLIQQIRMQNEENGWAVGKMNPEGSSLILQTNDGGENWVDRTPVDVPNTTTGPIQNPPDLFTVSAQVGWVVYPGQPGQEGMDIYVWATQDGGKNWTRSEALDLSGVTMDYFIPSDMGFVDPQFGWFLAHLGVGMSHDYFAIFTTSDGGQTWQRIADPDKNGDLQGCVKSGLVFTSSADGWFSGNCPGLMPQLFFYQTTDGGATWTPVDLPVPEGLTLSEAQTLGDRCGVPQITTLSTASNEIRFVLNCFDFDLNTSQSWLVTTSDNGVTWKETPMPLANATFNFISDQEGWLVGADDLSSQIKTIYHTLDGGQTWEVVINGVQGDQVDFVDSETGWIVVRDQNSLMYSDDGGTTWQKIEPLVSM